jgi:hypothetical protein
VGRFEVTVEGGSVLGEHLDEVEGVVQIGGHLYALGRADPIRIAIRWVDHRGPLARLDPELLIIMRVSVMGFSVTAAAGAMTARPYRSLWRSSDACAARSLPPPIHSCRTLTARMPPSQMMAASWCRTWNRVLDRGHVPSSREDDAGDRRHHTTYAADACALTRALTSGPGRPRSS